MDAAAGGCADWSSCCGVPGFESTRRWRWRWPHEGIPLPLIQRQLGHAYLSTTGSYFQGISTEEIIGAVHARKAPMKHARRGERPGSRNPWLSDTRAAGPCDRRLCHAVANEGVAHVWFAGRCPPSIAGRSVGGDRLGQLAAGLRPSLDRATRMPALVLTWRTALGRRAGSLGLLLKPTAGMPERSRWWAADINASGAIRSRLRVNELESLTWSTCSGRGRAPLCAGESRDHRCAEQGVNRVAGEPNRTAAGGTCARARA